MTETPTPPRRRRFQFGLRTMFVVVTVFAVWLAWELKVVRNRSEARKELVSRGALIQIGEPDSFTFAPSSNLNPSWTGRIPFYRRILGDEAVACIVVEPEDTGLATNLFPESAILAWER